MDPLNLLSNLSLSLHCVYVCVCTECGLFLLRRIDRKSDDINELTVPKQGHQIISKLEQTDSIDTKIAFFVGWPINGNVKIFGMTGLSGRTRLR